MNLESRLQRHRLAGLRSDVSRINQDRPHGDVYLGRVTGLSGSGATGPVMVGTYPAWLVATEAPGDPVDVDHDDSSIVPVALTRGTAQNDDLLIAHLIDGRWAAETEAIEAILECLCDFPLRDFGLSVRYDGAPIEIVTGTMHHHTGSVPVVLKPAGGANIFVQSTVNYWLGDCLSFPLNGFEIQYEMYCYQLNGVGNRGIVFGQASGTFSGGCGVYPASPHFGGAGSNNAYTLTTTSTSQPEWETPPFLRCSDPGAGRTFRLHYTTGGPGFLIGANVTDPLE